MGDDVIDYGCRLAAHRAARVLGEEFSPCLLPLPVIAPLPRRGAAGIVPGIPGATAGHLTGTERAVRHDLAAGAEMGRTAHGDYQRIATPVAVVPVE